MANTAGTKKTSSAKPNTTKSVKNEEATAPAKEVTAVYASIPSDPDMSQYIVVHNGFHGHLDYISKKTGEVYSWDSFGDSQDIELSELRNARSSQKAFFENNWFMFDDEDQWVIDFLGVRQFYQSGLNVDNFDSIFTKKPAEIHHIVGLMTDGQKRSLYYRAQELVMKNEIDSNKVIDALEKSLGASLALR